MNHRHKLALILTTALFVPLAVAGSLETRYHAVNTTIQPGQQVHVANLTVTGDNTTVENLTTQLEFSFNSTVRPNQTSLAPNESTNLSIYISPPGSFPTGSVTRTLTASSANHSVTQPVTVNITEYANWTVNRTTVTRNLSVGQQGTYTVLQLRELGNVNQRVTTNLTGNISAFLSLPDQVTVYRENPQTLSVSYDILTDQVFGYYNGTLTFTSTDNQTRNVTVAAQVRDTIAPEIGLTKIDDVPATKAETFKLKATDNLNVSNVTAGLYRRHSVNGSAAYRHVSDVEFAAEGNGVYSYEFTDTDDPGAYELRIVATDSSGNTDNVTEQFQVNRLNAVSILHDNFGVGHVIRGQEATHELFELNRSTPVTVTLRSITPSNTSVKLGVKAEDAAAAQYFTNGVGDEVTIEEPGTYHVVVLGKGSAAAATDFNAQFGFSTVRQHVNVSDVFFSARLIGGYGEPVNFTVNGMHGYTYYDDFQNGVPQTKGVRIEGPAGGCRNTSKMTEEGCIPNLNLDRIRNLTTQNQHLHTENRWKNAVIIIETALFMLVFVIFRQGQKHGGKRRVQAVVDPESLFNQKADPDDEDKVDDSAAEVAD